jgi:hypothetical protein
LTILALFGQGDRGNITGTIADPAGAVVANASIEARNTETGVLYPAQTTATGNYTLSQLPAGNYELSVTVPGFKKYVRQGLGVQVAATLRIDINLEVGATTDSITVTEAAALLKTESGELSHNVGTDRVNTLPILAIGAAAGSSGIRNPQATASLLPGTYVVPNSNVRVNGAPGNTASYRIEGQDASNGQVPATQAQVQPSVDSIQEVTIQTSNFAAEYGQVGGGFFNYTMRSGTNQLHGSAYDYWVNEVFNANTPWLNARKPAARRHDYGFTVGGPIVLPKLYNGHDRTFFFFNFEQFRETQNVSNQAITIPTAAYRAGDFTTARTARNLGTDPLGRAIIEGTIYDPTTSRAAPDGRIVRDAFPNNAIPVARMDPVALKIQALIPATNRAGLVNNAVFPYLSQRLTDIPSFKIDHNLSSKAHLSYFWQQTRTGSQFSPTLGSSDGLPNPITAAIGTFIKAHTQRLNYDYTVTPTVLFHLGAGYQDNNFNDDAPTLDYNQEASLGLKGATTARLFPALQNLSNAQGGVKNLGPAGNRHPLQYRKPTANTSLTWVSGNHTYKFGGEMRIDSNQSSLYTLTNGVYGFSGNQTALPYLQNATTGGGTIGFPYASFLLGQAESIRIAPVHVIRLAKQMWGAFAQDTWKVSRKLTVDYGVRWDYSGYLRDQYGRLPQFAPEIPNAAAGGHPGAVQFEGDGQGRCNCSFAKIYPWAFGPRIGAAYQINSKTVLRAGWGIVYGGTGDANGATQGGLTQPQAVNSAAFGEPVLTLRTGIPFTPLAYPNYDPNLFPQKSYDGTQAPPTWYDQNAGRPSRQVQWSFTLQREITKNLVVDASYVGNRGAWWNSPGLIDVNALTPERIKSYGLDINTPADRSLLNSRLDSALAAQRGFANRLPYSTFPRSLTVAQSLRPFPQFSTITSLWSPLGKTWYDSLQMKATQRFSHGLTATMTYTWQKNMAMSAPNNVTIPGTGGQAVNDVFNRSTNKYLSPFDQPQVLNFAVTYTVPGMKLGDGMGMKTLAFAAKDWSLSTFFQYASGIPFLAPVAVGNTGTAPLQNLLFRQTYANRVAGEPLFTQDLNCHCFDPNKEFVLNPKAWSQPAEGQFGGGAAYYTDYRQQRRPAESMGFGRIFRFTERMNLNLRIEFSNIFNRSVMPNPVSTNSSQTQTRNAGGTPTAGFGFINSQTVAATSPRQGTVVARFQF